jgi:hypothetical protein
MKTITFIKKAIKEINDNGKISVKALTKKWYILQELKCNNISPPIMNWHTFKPKKEFYELNNFNESELKKLANEIDLILNDNE